MDPIDRQYAIDKFEPWLKVKGYSEGERNMLKAVIYELRVMPSAQPERKKGAWINEGRIIRCNRCKIGYAAVKGMKSALTYKFCPHCGADMKGDTT